MEERNSTHPRVTFESKDRESLVVDLRQSINVRDFDPSLRKNFPLDSLREDSKNDDIEDHGNIPPFRVKHPLSSSGRVVLNDTPKVRPH